MIAEIAIVALITLIAFQDFQNRKERKKLVEAIMAKDLQDLKEGEKIEKQAPMKSDSPLPDFIPMDTANEEQFDKAIRKELGRETLKEKTVDRAMEAIKEANK